jgi:hypothetical protein
VFYLVSGLWPLVHLQSFLTVTGPKTDLWLVKTLGVLISVIGAVLGMSRIPSLGLRAESGRAQAERERLACTTPSFVGWSRVIHGPHLRAPGSQLGAPLQQLIGRALPGQVAPFCRIGGEVEQLCRSIIEMVDVLFCPGETRHASLIPRATKQ